MSDNHITGAPIPIEIDGKEFRFSPFDDVDFTELDNWVQQRFIKQARASLDEKSSQRDRDETMEIAMRTASGLSAFSGTGARVMSTIEGMSRLLYQAICKCHPDQTVESVRKMMFAGGKSKQAAKIREVNDKFKAANLPEEILNKKPATTGKKGGAHKKRRRR